MVRKSYTVEDVREYEVHEGEFSRFQIEPDAVLPKSGDHRPLTERAMLSATALAKLSGR